MLWDGGRSAGWHPSLCVLLKPPSESVKWIANRWPRPSDGQVWITNESIYFHRALRKQDILGSNRLCSRQVQGWHHHPGRVQSDRGGTPARPRRNGRRTPSPSSPALTRNPARRTSGSLGRLSERMSLASSTPAGAATSRWSAACACGRGKSCASSSTPSELPQGHGFPSRGRD